MDAIQNINKVILVLGGTGLLGKPVATSLAGAGYQVRILTRNPQKASQVFDRSFEIIAGDPTDPSCLEQALDGCYGVHISLPPEIEQQVAESVAKLASEHGLERITYISGATVAEETRWFPMVERKFLAEKAIKESGIPYTIFCSTWVMEVLPKFVNKGQASVIGNQPYPYHWVSAEDIARMVSSAYGLAGAANQRIIVLGPEGIRMSEALRRYCMAFHPEVKKISTMPVWLFKLLATITGNRELEDVCEMMSYFEVVGEGLRTERVNAICGLPITTLDMWLRRAQPD